MAHDEPQLERQRVWDLPTRLFHWALVALFAFSWASAELLERLDWHRLSGYGVLGLLLFRLWWGLLGSYNVRFSNLLRGPQAVRHYLRHLGQRPSLRLPGHNAMGGWSVAAMLLALAAQVGTGLFAVDTDGLESGPLASHVSFDVGRGFAEAHELAFNVLLALVALHLTAVLFYLLYQRENLVAGMIHGDQWLHPGATRQLRFASLGRALLGAALAAALVLGLVYGLGA